MRLTYNWNHLMVHFDGGTEEHLRISILTALQRWAGPALFTASQKYSPESDLDALGYVWTKIHL